KIAPYPFYRYERRFRSSGRSGQHDGPFGPGPVRATANGGSMNALIAVLTTLLYAFIILMLIRVVFSWVSPFPTNPVSRLAWQATEPVLAPVRRRLPPMSGIDLSPMVVMLAAYLLIAIIGNLGVR